MMQEKRLTTQSVSQEPHYLAPDGSEIRLLPTLDRGGLAHCTLQPGRSSLPVAHHTVEEIWFFLEGEGEVWRKQGEEQTVVYVSPGMSLTIPQGTHFQFRNMGTLPLRFLIATMPPWPGPQEAYPVVGYWETTPKNHP
jgi:mannose-6-phosphate isomerase-like protein (cupin superfamily)